MRVLKEFQVVQTEKGSKIFGLFDDNTLWFAHQNGKGWNQISMVFNEARVKTEAGKEYKKFDANGRRI